MSFDIFLQRFVDGDAAPASDVAALRAVLEPHLERAAGGERLRCVDGQAALYSWDSVERGFMVNHASGREIWDLLVRAARAADLVIMPVGCATVLIDAEQAGHLPAEMTDDVLLVTSGAELLACIESD